VIFLSEQEPKIGDYSTLGTDKKCSPVFMKIQIYEDLLKQPGFIHWDSP